MFWRLYDSPDVVTCPKMRAKLFSDAVSGAEFLVNAIRPKDGNYYFSVSEDGKTGLHVQRKPYTAVFYCLACLETYRVLRKYNKKTLENKIDFLSEARDAFHFVVKCLNDPRVCGAIAPTTTTTKAPPSILGEVMCLSGMSEEFLKVLPGESEYWMKFIENAMARVVPHFDKISKVFMETVIDTTRGVDHTTSAGRLLNPGHSIEVSWAIFRLTKIRKSEKHLNIALEALEGALKSGWDEKKGGGITYMKDVLSKPLLDTTVVAEHKLWWPMCEALYACTLALEITDGDAKWMKWLERIHNYIYKHFCDDVKSGGGGEWFGYLRPDGTVFNRTKGGNYKGCFHVPRALLFSIQCASRYLKKKGS